MSTPVDVGGKGLKDFPDVNYEGNKSDWLLWVHLGMCGVSDNTEKTDTAAPILTLSVRRRDTVSVHRFSVNTDTDSSDTPITVQQ